MEADKPKTVQGTVHMTRVAIIDDDAWAVRGIASALEDATGFDVVAEEYNGSNGVKAVLEHHPDVVLMDVNMPGGTNGIAATAQIRQMCPTARVIVLTTLSPGPGLARALEAGAIGVVTKSDPPDVLVAAIRQVMDDDEPGALKNLAETIFISGDPMPDSPAVPPRLTSAEQSILEYIARGMSYADIAEELTISPATVRTHAQRLREKLNAHSLSQLVYRGLQMRFISVY